YLERLCVLEDRPFELYEVPDFFKSDEKWDRRKIRNTHETLQHHHIIEFQSYQPNKNKGAGYTINDFIAEPLRYYLKELQTPIGDEDKQTTEDQKEEGTNE
ncbi:hypothetical protein JW979_10375, partial [bacterium]|nr:hypothetical protein [candidate division CSSED10-310 bacterium]